MDIKCFKNELHGFVWDCMDYMEISANFIDDFIKSHEDKSDFEYKNDIDINYTD